MIYMFAIVVAIYEFVIEINDKLVNEKNKVFVSWLP